MIAATPAGCIAQLTAAPNNMPSAHCASSGANGMSRGYRLWLGCAASSTRAISAVSQYTSAPTCSTGVLR